jgi:hypothetical protein
MEKMKFRISLMRGSVDVTLNKPSPDILQYHM